MKQTVYILLPAHNRRAVTGKFIDCLLAQACQNFHLVLIDDGSVDGTAAMVAEKISKLTVLRGSGNWWWAGSLQQGINWLNRSQVSGQSIVMFANDDITFGTDFLQKAVAILEGNSRTLALPQVANDRTGFAEETGVEADMQNFTFRTAASASQINCMTTRGICMRMSDLREIGGFHPRILPHYWSDYEFTIRAHRSGFRLLSSPEFLIKYDKDQSGYRSFQNSSLSDFFRQYFSIKSVVNPVYQSSFVLLACRPVKYIPVNLFRTWKAAFALVYKQVRHRIKSQLVRHRVKAAIKKNRKDLKIIIGSESSKQDGWVSTNYPMLDLTDRQTFLSLFEPGGVHNFLAEHVWEHLSLSDGVIASQNCYEFLKPGGRLRIAVPDAFHTSTEYLAQVRPGGSGPGAEDHKTFYNYKMLSVMLENTGFHVRLLEWFDELGAFHSEQWNAMDGFVLRSTQYDPRNKTNPTAYTSLIIDAIKPE